MNTKMKMGKKKLEPRPWSPKFYRERNVYPKCKPFLVSANAYVCMVHGALYKQRDTHAYTNSILTTYNYRQ